MNAVPYVPPVSPASAQYLVPSTQNGENDMRRGRAIHLPLSAGRHGKEIFVETSLVGRHQLRNVALAIAAAVELNQQGFADSITAKTIETGIRETRWPGRFQVIAAQTAGRRWSSMWRIIRREPGPSFSPFGTFYEAVR